MTGKEYNAEKLHKELTAAGLEISGVTCEGRIDWKDIPTEEMTAQAEQIKSVHTPFSKTEALRQAYREMGLDSETLLRALWEKIMENNSTTADQIQTTMSEIKSKMSSVG